MKMLPILKKTGKIFGTLQKLMMNWSIDDLKRVWNEMEKIEPLTTEK